MDLYFAPLACSMSSRITLYEAGAEARFHCVDTKAKRVLSDGSDFNELNPLGMVPVLRTDDGELLKENPAILQYVADRFPAAGMAPPAGPGALPPAAMAEFHRDGAAQGRLHPVARRARPGGRKDYAREKAKLRLSYLDRHLEGRDYLLDSFSVADAYLVTVLNWSQASGIDLAEWPSVHAFYRRTLTRPSVARAVAEERALYAEEQARRKAA